MSNEVRGSKEDLFSCQYVSGFADSVSTQGWSKILLRSVQDKIFLADFLLPVVLYKLPLKYLSFSPLANGEWFPLMKLLFFNLAATASNVPLVFFFFSPLGFLKLMRNTDYVATLEQWTSSLASELSAHILVLLAFPWLLIEVSAFCPTASFHSSRSSRNFSQIALKLCGYNYLEEWDRQTVSLF